jgi:hypothetical protein
MCLDILWIKLDGWLLYHCPRTDTTSILKDSVGHALTSLFEFGVLWSNLFSFSTSREKALSS